MIGIISVSCKSQLNVDIFKKLNRNTVSLKLGKSETIGSCVFNNSPRFINNINFSYLLTFSKEINSATAISQTILNSGTGGAANLIWAIQDCGDNKNFKIEPTAILGDGTIIPDVSNILSAVSTDGKNIELENNIIQTTVNYDTQNPSVVINQSSLENVGSCSFGNSIDPTNLVGFSYKVTFSEVVNSASFTIADVNNSGTGGGTSLVWGLENCGDGQNFKLVANVIVGDGTIIPNIPIGVLTDLAGNTNTASSSTDNSITYDSSSLLVNINQSLAESIGTCNFIATTDPTNAIGASYKIAFSKNINASSFVIGDITNSGTSGNIGWSLSSCGDGLTYKLVANTIEFNGTIIPTIAAGVVLDPIGSGNEASTDTDNTVTYDNSRPSVTVNQATTETVGSCSFSASTNPTHLNGFNYKVIFSEEISLATFATGDITNDGTSGLVVWNLQSCGDSKVFKLSATSVASDGTVIPSVNLNSVSDFAGNLNTLSTATDNSVTYDATVPNVIINQSILETVGSCSFSAMTDPTNTAGFSYRVQFSEVIDANSFISSDISNIGTGGSTTLTWQLDNCGDDQNFKLTASTVVGNGTIIPSLSASTIYDIAGNFNSLSTATDNSVTYNSDLINITISRSIAETVGSCLFTNTNTVQNNSGFDFKVVFSEIINNSSFTVADVTNNGTGGAGTLIWSLTNCGDDQNYKLTATDLNGNGTISPLILASKVLDLNGNSNLLSTLSNGVVDYQFFGWEQEAYIKAVNNSASDYFGSKVSINGDTLAVGTTQEDSSATTITNGSGFSKPGTSSDSGAVYVYKRSGDTWAQEAYVKAVNNGAYDYFGSSVSINGDTMAVGAMSEDSSATTITNGPGFSKPGSTSNTGAVYVYKRSGNVWAQEAYIKAVNAESNNIFGNSVSINGNTIAVGSPRESSNSTTITNGSSVTNPPGYRSDSGAVYVYKRSGNTWAQEAFIKGVNNDLYYYFGNSVSLSGDTLAVGAMYESSNATTITNGSGFSMSGTNTSSGAVYVYKRYESMWVQEAYVKAVNSGVNDYFGTSVSISGDTMVVGARAEDSNATIITNGAGFSGLDLGLTNDSGAVYVYKRSGNTWSQEAYIKAVNNGAGDFFGYSVSISGDTIVVGAYNEDSNSTTITSGSGFSDTGTSNNSGAVYVYKRSGNTWAQEAYIKAINNGANDYFGMNVSISGDTIAVGASQENSNATTITNGPGFSEPGDSAYSGAVYIYRNKYRLFSIQDVFKTNSSTTSLTLNWIKSGFKTAGYFIAYAKGFNTPVDCASGTVVDVGNNTSYTFNSLDPATHYSFKICSYDSTANVSSGYVITFSTSSFLPEPGSLNAVINSDRASTVDWASAGGTVTGYKIAYQQGPIPPITCNDGTVIDVGNVLTYQLTGLLTNTDYGVRVCSYDGLTNLSLGKYITIKTNKTLDPINVYTTSTDITNDTLTVHWTSVGDRVTGFKIAWKSGPATPVDCSTGTVVDVGNVTIHSIGGLTAGSSYGIRICAYETGVTNISNGVSLNGNVRNDGWVEEAHIKAVNNGAGDFFGTSVSISGDTMAVGATREDSDATTITNGAGFSGVDSGLTNDSGAVYVYKRSGNTWSQEAYIKAVNNGADDYFGSSVSLSGDTMAVGAYNEDSNATTITNGPGFSGLDSGFTNNSGAVYVYKRSGNTWAQEAYIKAVNSGANDYLGGIVSINGDTLAVGARAEDSNATTITNGPSFSEPGSTFDSGAVYVYKRSGNTWSQEAYIKAVNSGASDNFGSSVSIEDDTLVVGAYTEDSDATTITNGPGISGLDSGLTNHSGAVYIYKRSGNTWSQEAYIKAVNNGAGDYFGSWVSISGDTLVVGATSEDSNATTITNGAGFSGTDSASGSGAVYVYKRSGDTWSEEAYIKPSYNRYGIYFGTSVTIQGDTLAVGVEGEDSTATTITNGTSFSKPGSISSSGAVYVYKRSGSFWSQEAYIKAVNSNGYYYFGGSVAINGDTLVVGSRGESSSATTITHGSSFSKLGTSPNSGAVYVYRNNARLFPVTEVFPIITSDSISLKWHKTGGTAVGYGVNVDVGIGIPSLCSFPLDHDLGNVNELVLGSLTPGTDYSFRICVYDSSNQFEGDTVINLKTNP